MDGLPKFKDALDIDHKMKNNFTIPYGTVPKITLDDIRAGYITRYFLQILSNKTVLEIDKTQYDRFHKNPLYTAVSFRWYITGELVDLQLPNGNISKGVISKNLATINFYSKSIPEIQRFIFSPYELYSGSKTLPPLPNTPNDSNDTIPGRLPLPNTPNSPIPGRLPLPNTPNSPIPGRLPLPNTPNGPISDNSPTPPRTNIPGRTSAPWWPGWPLPYVPPQYIPPQTPLPIPTQSPSTPPSPPISSITYTALDIAAGELSYYVLRSDNTLWSWGWNGEGELGLGDWDDRALPTQIAGSWQNISVGAYSLLAVKTDNTLWGAGYNLHANLGVGDTTDKNTMTQVSGNNWYKVSTAVGYGDHTLAIKTNGTLWAWGGNTWGELGIGSTGGPDQLTPVQVGSDTDWAYVHAVWGRSFAIKTNGTLWSWGSNGSTALGQGDSNPVAVYNTPTQVGIDTNWTKLSSAWAFTFALKSNGTLWVTGTNVSYGLGVGSTNTSLEYNTFTQVGSATDWVDISCGYEQCVARKTDGSIYTWGYNADGELGLGDTTNRASPTQVGTATDWTDISGGLYDALAVKNNILTYWGWNFNDYLGTGNEPELSPVSLPYSSNILY